MATVGVVRLQPSAGPGLSGQAAALHLSVPTWELHVAVLVLGDGSSRKDAMSFSSGFGVCSDD